MRYSKLLENLDSKNLKETSFRRYSLSEIISESYKSLYSSERGTNLQRLAEAHLEDVRRNPTEVDRLSRQLCKIKALASMVESKEIKDEELLVPEEKYDTVEPKEKKEDIKESKDEKMTPDEMKDYWEKNKTKDPVLANYKSYDEWYKDSKENGYVTDDEEDIEESAQSEDDVDDLLEDTELTDEEVEQLTKHLAEIRKNKKVNEASDDNRIYQYGIDIEQESSADPVATEKDLEKVLSDAGYAVVGCMAGDNSWSKTEYGLFDSKKVDESKSYDKSSLSNFSKKSSGKAFVKTFKKLDAKLHEGTALTRQESISLYKAANSAMTHLSVELEHNPEFLPVFNESVTLLSVDVARLLESMKNDKAPSKATMKSLAKFSEAILREDEEEELPPIEDEEENIVSEEEVEQFDQEYAEARFELHQELVDEHADEENPEIEERLAQDAEEIVDLPGVTDEQIAELQGEEAPAPEESEGDEVIVGEEEVDLPAEGEANDSEEEIEETEELSLDDVDLSDDELAELKKHLKEMRETKKIKESKGRRLMRRK